MKKEYMFLEDDYSDRPNVLFFEEHIHIFKKQDSILDIGCGIGNSSRFFPNWTGITVNKSEYAEGKRLNRNVHLCDVHDLSQLYGNLFDGIIMWDSLEHFVSPYIALSEARKITNKNSGQLLIFMPGENWMWHHNHIHVMYTQQVIHILARTGWCLQNIYIKKYSEERQISLNSDGMAVYTAFPSEDCEGNYKFLKKIREV